MKIKEVSTKQFAGIRDRRILLHDGVNVIFGKNEAGKSTFVNLVLGLLFQDVKIDGRKDKSFKENAFPAVRIDGGSSGDKIDGNIVLGAENGDYTLHKVWKKDSEGNSELSTPKADFGSWDKISDELNDLLGGYAEGVYRELLFSPQSFAADNLKTILECEKSQSLKTLTDRITAAYAESGGVSIDGLEKKINDIIFEFTGKQWDITQMAPIHNDYRRKPKSRGSILDAKTELEDVESALNEFNERDREAANAVNELRAAEEEAAKADDEFKKFDKYFLSIQTRDANQKIKDAGTNDLKRYKIAGEDYPNNKRILECAERLKKERDDRAKYDKYQNAREHKKELDEIKFELGKLKRPDESEIRKVKKADEEIGKLENSLSKMNIAAKIKMHGENPLKIYSRITGEEIAFDGEDVNIREAVRVEIPNVMEMYLAPADVDADKITREISEYKKTKADILEKYGCNDLSLLKNLADTYDKLSDKKTAAEKKFSEAAGSEDIEVLKKCVEDIGAVREKSAIENDIRELCGEMNLDEYIGGKRKCVEAFENEFISEEELCRKIQACENEIKKADNALNNAENIPEEYRKISNPDEYKKELHNKAEMAREREKAAISKKSAAEKALENINGDELREKRNDAEQKYNEQRERLKNWLHIQEVFNKHKRALFSNPFTDIAKSFTGNLKIISDKNVSAELKDEKKLDFNLTTGDFKADTVKLSDGTRDTVYLAFRLAALDRLFPDGGGVIILDDPLNDMDIDRVKKSCALIKKYAERHQIILLTCREEYADILGESSLRW